MWDYDADLKYYGKHETLHANIWKGYNDKVIATEFYSSIVNYIRGLCFVFCLVYAVYGNISLAVSSSDPDTPLTTVCI